MIYIVFTSSGNLSLIILFTARLQIDYSALQFVEEF